MSGGGLTVRIPVGLSCAKGDSIRLLEQLGCVMQDITDGWQIFTLPEGWSASSDGEHDYFLDTKERIRVQIGPCGNFLPGQITMPTVIQFVPFYHIVAALKDHEDDGCEMLLTVVSGNQQEILRRHFKVPYGICSVECYIVLDKHIDRLGAQLLELYPECENVLAYWEN